MSKILEVVSLRIETRSGTNVKNIGQWKEGARCDDGRVAAWTV
jgi:hypothetical protein